MQLSLVTLALSVLAGCGQASGGNANPRLPEGFWAAWGDGKAEIDAYRLTTPRYGAARSGYAVHVFVAETFTDAQRVKSDGGHPDEFPVLKLNELRRFQTGIYDYALMTSTFSPLDGRLPIGQPTKVTFGSQEWCGALFDELVVDPGRARRSRRSYFDGEGDTDSELRLPPGAVLGDALPVLVRGLLGEHPSEAEFLPTLAEARLQHTDLAAVHGTLRPATTTHAVDVPAGRFDVRTTTLSLADGRTVAWDIEDAAPHRIVAWRRSDGESAELVGSARRAYWQEHDPGDEGLLDELGLRPPEWLR